MDAAQRERLLAAVRDDWRGAALAAEDVALCAFGQKLTESPGRMSADDVAALRAAGFDDGQIHDALQVVAYFNYINRVADAVHVELEPGMPPYPRG